MKYFYIIFYGIWALVLPDALCPLLAQSTILQIEFQGNRHYSAGELLKRSGLVTGRAFSPHLIDVANHNIIGAYREDGYLYARIDSVGMTVLSDQQTGLIWYIEEDKPFQLGKIEIQNELYPPVTILDLLDLKTGEIYRETRIESELKQIGLFFARKGYPLTSVKPLPGSIKRQNGYYSLDLMILVNSGKKITINEFSIKGNHHTRNQVILRELDMKQGDTYDQDKIDRIPQNLNRLGFFKNVHPPVVLMKDSVSTHLSVEVEEGNTTTFDGIIGYIPAEGSEKTKQGYFTGLIQLGFRNLFGTGRRFDVDWKKPDRYSDEFKLFYEEPWIYNLPLNLGFALERIVRDTIYIERSYWVQSTIRLNSNFRAKIQFQSKSTIPDSTASRDLRLTENSTLITDLGLEYDSRDYVYNPRGGLLYRAFYSVGLKKNNGPSYLLQEDSLATKEQLQSIRLEFSFNLHVTGNQVLMGNFTGKSIESNKNQLQISDHFWFGGTNSLRGYRENQFHGTTVSWVNLEYRFLTGRDSRIFIFNDWGYYYYNDSGGKMESLLPGYGIGLRFRTPLGILGVDYGLGKGDTFSTGKIHFSMVNLF